MKWLLPRFLKTETEIISLKKTVTEILTQFIFNVIRIYELELRGKQAEFLLVETEKQYKRIVETILGIAFQLDSGKNISFINSPSQKLGFQP